MTLHKRSCDQHVRRQTGCHPCLIVARRYQERARLIAYHKGLRLSAPSDLVTQWLRELRAGGYSTRVLGEHIGSPQCQITRLSNGTCDRVQLKTFHAVQQTYQRLRGLPGGDARAARTAARHGWTPPPPLPMPEPMDEHEVDEVAVERAVKGERIALTRAETLAAWTVLEGRGMTANKIAERLHTTEKTVQRWRSGAHRPASSRAHKRTA